ncbi:MAG: AMP-binding protein [Myxococcales bacterium]|nr:AMP-binding protein [Myxococcales bacterium]
MPIVVAVSAEETGVVELNSTALWREFAQWADRQPEAPAVIGPEEQLNYQELADQADRIAEHLQARDRIALELPRSPTLIAAILGTWKVGASFCIIPPDLPPLRRALLLARSSCNCRLQPGRAPVRSGPPAPSSQGLAYVAFTSGTTQEPRGALIEARGLLLTLQAQIRLFRLGPKSRNLWVLAPSFHGSLSDIGTALLSGAQLHLGSLELLKDPNQLIQYIDRHEITTVDLPPSMLSHLPMMPPSLETVVFGGEPAPPTAVRQWASSVRMFNVYGPTEATMCTHIEECTTDWYGQSLGTPLPHVHQHIENEELWVGGPNVARSLIGAPNHVLFHEDGVRWYRTGDRVQAHQHGLRFLGRIERQVHVHGGLVEPEAIPYRYRAPSHRAQTSLCTERKKTSTLEMEITPLLASLETTCPAAPPQTPPLRSNLLVIGGTGFLGTALRTELEAYGYDPIYLVRAHSLDEALHRVGGAQVLIGDLTQPRLGLAQPVWDGLASTLHTIIHLGAHLRMVTPIDELRDLHLKGTAELIRLAKLSGARFVYASTLSVLASSDRQLPLYLESDPATAPTTLGGGYAQNKWATEQLVRRALPTTSTIIRYGLLVDPRKRPNPSQTPPKDWLSRFIRDTIQSGNYPKGIEKLCFDAIPVDHSAQATMRLCWAPSGTYHVASAQPTPVAELLRTIREAGHPLVPIPDDQTRHPSVLGCSFYCPSEDWAQGYDLWVPTNTQFDTQEAQKWGFSPLTVDDAFLRALVERAM